ncbi:MAG: outer membrane beta-barrel protein [Bacteroidota bacterium]
MRKKLFALILCLGMYQGLLAQNFGGGISLGANISQVDGDAFGGFNQGGVSVGGFVYYPLAKQLFLQPEINFDQLGSAAGGFLVLRTTHISVPVLLKLALPVELGNSTQELLFHIGPVFGYLLSARDFNLDQTQNLNRIDYRAVAGVSYRFSRRTSFLIRYGYSVVSFVPTNVSPVSIIAQGRTGLAHNYVHLSLRFHLID